MLKYIDFAHKPHALEAFLPFSSIQTDISYNKLDCSLTLSHFTLVIKYLIFIQASVQNNNIFCWSRFQTPRISTVKNSRKGETCTCSTGQKFGLYCISTTCTLCWTLKRKRHHEVELHHLTLIQLKYMNLLQLFFFFSKMHSSYVVGCNTSQMFVLQKTSTRQVDS